MEGYKEKLEFTTKDSPEPRYVWVYDREKVFLSETFPLSPTELIEVIEIMLAGGDPTKGVDKKGKRYRYASPEARTVDFMDLLRNYMRAYGETYRDPLPVFFDKFRSRLCQITPGDSYSVLAPLGIAAGHPTYKAISQNLFLEATSPSARQWPEREVSRMAHIAQDFSAMYIRYNATSLVKITADNFEVVPLGTDGVLVKGDSMGDLPDFDAMSEEFEDLKELIGKAITKPVPASPMTDFLTTRFSTDSTLTPEQAQWVLLTRVMFLFACSRHPALWPMLLLTGETGSGKSTPFEILLVILAGRMMKLDSVPTTMRSMVSYVTSHDICLLDNVDNAFGQGSDEVQNLICHVSTGAQISIAELYATNKNTTHTIQSNAFFTARDNPFSREDVQRRVLTLQTAKGAGDTVKTRILETVLRWRTDIWAEILVRCQNMLLAHRDNYRKSYRYQSRMKEYEFFTLLCADYEDALPEAEALWTAYMDTYNASITEDNSTLTAVMLWLGESGASSHGTPVHTETLFQQISTLYKKLGLDMPWRASNTFGKALTNNLLALRQGAGMTDGRDSQTGRRVLYFSPNEQQLQVINAVYRGVTNAGGTKVREQVSFKEILAARRAQKVSSENRSEAQSEA